MTGSRNTGYLEGMKHLEADRVTLPDASRTGLWSTLDAPSYFDDPGVIRE
jgi:hypothetical protein